MEQHGGKRLGAGRKPKAKEEQVRRLGIDAISKIYGSLDEYYEHIATESKQSFPHLKLLQEYVFGKPKETIVLDQEEENEFDLQKLSDKELALLVKINDKQQSSS
tara:strand:+ start:28 stop:342 length:315 start_codon:yes stop_codon:yes gene_type:complete